MGLAAGGVFWVRQGAQAGGQNAGHTPSWSFCCPGVRACHMLGFTRDTEMYSFPQRGSWAWGLEGRDITECPCLLLFSCSSEFGGAFECAGDGEGEEAAAGAPQAAVQAAATEEAVWRHIRTTPALYRKVLLYQPFELAELQAELRQHGIRMAMGKLLDFLDAHCITFTSAAARKEKLERKRRQPVGRKKRVRTNGPVPASLSPAVSSL